MVYRCFLYGSELHKRSRSPSQIEMLRNLNLNLKIPFIVPQQGTFAVASRETIHSKN